MPRRFLLLTLAAALLLGACSIDVSDPTAVPTVEVPNVAPPGQASATPNAAVTLPPSAGPDWADRGLTGSLLYTLGLDGIQRLDLATGQTFTVFDPPENAWLTAASLSPDGTRLALAYAPPPPEGQVQLGYTDVYELPGECVRQPTPCTADSLTPLLERADPHEAYFSPLWSPDGQYLYYAHFMPSDSEAGRAFAYTLRRLRLDSGETEVVANDALWPALSPDGSRLAYVWSNPDDFTNDLIVADADGRNTVRLATAKDFEAVDAPLFSPDGETLLFSAVSGAAPAASAWLDWLTGARPAEAAPLAHNVPSDWWSVPVAGGAYTRLTEVYDTSMFGAFSPDGEYVAYLSATGLYLMRPDGSDLVRLSSTTAYGTLAWLP